MIDDVFLGVKNLLLTFVVRHFEASIVLTELALDALELKVNGILLFHLKSKSFCILFSQWVCFTHCVSG